MKPCVEVEIMFSRSKEVKEFARKIITTLNIMIAKCGLSNCLRIIIKMIYPYLRVFLATPAINVVEKSKIYNYLGGVKTR
jgi:hypothetical protein